MSGLKGEEENGENTEKSAYFPGLLTLSDRLAKVAPIELRISSQLHCIILKFIILCFYFFLAPLQSY
jgi:hypothetical protein